MGPPIFIRKGKMNITLSEALLRRKDLTGRIALIELVLKQEKFEPKVVRVVAHEGIVDDVTAHIPRLSKEQVMKEKNWHCATRRELDSMIQKANWNTPVSIPVMALSDFDGSKSYDEELCTEKVLTDLLNRRKELEERCRESCTIQKGSLIEVKKTRLKASEGAESMIIDVDKIAVSELLAEYNFYSKSLRLVDGAIHEKNCRTVIKVEESWMKDYADQ